MYTYTLTPTDFFPLPPTPAQKFKRKFAATDSEAYEAVGGYDNADAPDPNVDERNHPHAYVQPPRHIDAHFLNLTLLLDVIRLHVHPSGTTPANVDPPSIHLANTMPPDVTLRHARDTLQYNSFPARCRRRLVQRLVWMFDVQRWHLLYNPGCLSADQLKV